MVQGSAARTPEAAERLKCLGLAIRRARLPLTQAQIAERLGRPQSSISEWEHGLVDLPIEVIHQIEQALGVTSGRLLIEAGYINPSDEPLLAALSEHRRQKMLGDGPASFPVNIVRWLVCFGPLLDALIVLRDHDDTTAVDALLEVKPVRILRLSWEFLDSLTLPLDERPDQGLAALCGDDVLQRCRYALWGQRQHLIAVPS